MTRYRVGVGEAFPMAERLKREFERGCRYGEARWREESGRWRGRIGGRSALWGLATLGVLAVLLLLSRGRRHGRHGRIGAAERETMRVRLEMPPQAMERLQQLKDKTEAASYAEVIRNALRLYEALIAEAERGAEFQVKGPDGVAVPYRIFYRRPNSSHRHCERSNPESRTC